MPSIVRESKHTLHCSDQKNNVTIVTTSSLILIVDFVRILLGFVFALYSFLDGMM